MPGIENAICHWLAHRSTGRGAAPADAVAVASSAREADDGLPPARGADAPSHHDPGAADDGATGTLLAAGAPASGALE